MGPIWAREPVPEPEPTEPSPPPVEGPGTDGPVAAVDQPGIFSMVVFAVAPIDRTFLP